jgi:hypothetical protein
VELRRGIRTIFAPKTQRLREIPIKLDTCNMREARWLGEKNETVFYNPETGMQAGLRKSEQKRKKRGKMCFTRFDQNLLTSPI